MSPIVVIHVGHGVFVVILSVLALLFRSRVIVLSFSSLRPFTPSLCSSLLLLDGSFSFLWVLRHCSAHELHLSRFFFSFSSSLLLLVIRLRLLQSLGNNIHFLVFFVILDVVHPDLPLEQFHAIEVVHSQNAAPRVSVAQKGESFRLSSVRVSV